ncbi:ABC transporter permease [Segeticoccus rhizosphaerae]|jgi:peptide/nickel transport system permease protein|uniref:ABC transporter permease n=1 Tax=Segeticoccus rhizosphaerae TaxID=1104777 RepID=UPI0010BFAB8D|nr:MULTISPECIES: ABC transporter permease [Intrasporangiaceae]
MTVTAGEFDVDSAIGGEERDTTIAGRSPGQIARSRFRRDKVSMVCLAILVFFILLAIAAPILNAVGVIDPDSGHPDLVQGIGSMPTGHLGGVSSDHWLGVEPQTGRDLLSRVVVGLTSSFIIAASATFIAIFIGTVVGIISGFSGGWVDTGLGRFMDLVLAFPQLLMLLALSQPLKDRLTAMGVPDGNTVDFAYVIIVLGFFGWPYFARIIRGQVLSLREREFVEAARSLGAKGPRIWFTELLPNIWAPILVYMSLILPQYIAAEATLSFLGVGIRPPTPTLGSLLTDSVNYLLVDPMFFWAPGGLLVIIVLAFNLVGDGLRDALDPKSDRH